MSLTFNEQILLLDGLYDRELGRGFRDEVSGHTFDVSERGQRQIASEALAATLVCLGRLVEDAEGVPPSWCVGWSVEYRFPDRDAQLVHFSPDEMIAFAQRARVYCAWLWQRRCGLVRDIRAGLVRDVEYEWSAWLKKNPFGGVSHF